MPPPVSLVGFAGGFPPGWVFESIDVAIVILLVLLAVGFRTRIVSVALLALLLFGNSFEQCLGKIDHDGLLPMLVLFVMAFADWGKRSSCLGMLALLISFGYFSAAFSKAIHWIDFDLQTSGVKRWVFEGFYNLDRNQLLAPYAIQIENPWVWEMMDIAGVIFELGFFFALLSRRTWCSWLCLACLFHLGNTLLLNITFLANLPCYLVFATWTRWRVWLVASVGVAALLAGPMLGSAILWAGGAVIFGGNAVSLYRDRQSIRSC